MYENNKKEKDEILNPDKIKNKKFNSSIISPKKVVTKNSIKIKKGVYQIQKRPKIIIEEDNNTKNIKIGHNSPDIKSKTNEINALKEYQKNITNQSNQIKIQKQKKFQKYSNNNSTINNNNNNNPALNIKEDNYDKNNQENKTINNNKIFVNPKKQNINNYKTETNNSINISHSHNSKRIKINIINKTKNNRNMVNEKKKSELSIELIKNDNYIDNFTVEECDENTDKNFLNSRKHYSLTNPNILPCIPFSNPFSKNNTNNTNHNLDINEKKEINKDKDNTKNNNKKNYFNQGLLLNNVNDNNIIENENDEQEDIKLNISNLEIDIETINDKLEEEQQSSKIDSPIRNFDHTFKSFIQFNNNLSFKLAAEKAKNTPSYMLALCPKLYMGFNKKKIIKENYAVNDAISEEMDSDTLTPKNSKNKNSIEEKNTKYSTKEKYSDRNKKQNEFESEDGSYEIEKKNTSNNFNNSNSERKNKNNQNNSNSVYNIYKNIFQSKKQKIIDNINYEKIITNNENNSDEHTKTIVNKKNDKKKKKLNIKDINIETQNINNITINNDIKNTLIKINCFLTSPNKSNVSYHHSNNAINNIVYNETENNKVHSKIIKIKNNEYKERHQKAKSLLSNINLSTLHLYETIQNNNNSNINIMGNKKPKLLKNNIKSTDYRNKILNKEKKVIENDTTGTNNSILKKKTNEKHLFNENNRTNSYKNDDNKNNNVNSNGLNSNNNNNNKKLKKIAYSHLLKSPKYKVNPFLSNFANNTDKPNYNSNNENLYTLHNTENKYSNYYELFKKRNNNYKINNINNNTINTINSNNDYNCTFTNEINTVRHCKKISQQFIDEYNLLLETKSDNNNTMTSAKDKILNNNYNSNNNENTNNNGNIKKKNSLNKYFSYNTNQKNNNSKSKETPDVNNKNNKCKLQINKGNNNNSIKKISQITPCHKKSRTFFISPSYVIKNINHINEKINNNNNNKDNNKKVKENKNYNLNNLNIHQKSNFLTSKKKCNHQKRTNINYITNKKIICKNRYSSKNSNIENKDKNIINNEKKKTKFSEIKKVIGETFLTKIIHKKTNTIGNTNALSNFLFVNFFNYNKKNNKLSNNNNNSNSTRNNSNTIPSRQLKKAASINNLMNNDGNRKKIINAMQRIKFIPVSNYSRAIKELFKSNNNNFVILVYIDQNQRFIFRGLYETYEKSPKIANKLFAPNYGQNNININNINYFFNYSFDRGDFVRYKFNNEKNKKFNEDTIIIF